MEDKYLDKTGLAYFWGKIKAYFQANLPSVPSPADSAPLMDGASSVGSSSDYAREDHVHPTDTSRATDSDVVHKAGTETVTGHKTFTDVLSVKDAVLSLGTSSQLKHSVDFELANKYEDGNEGVAVLSLDDPSGDGDVIIRSVYFPILGNDAANKEYVDESVSSVAPWNKRISLPEDVILSSGGHSVSVTMPNQSTTPPKGVYMVCGQAMIINQNSKSQQGHAILRYRLSSNGNYVNVAATSFTIPGARTSTHGGTYGASSVFIQGLATLSVKPSYIEFRLSVEVETDGSDSILVATAPSSGSYADAIDPSSVNDPSATNLVIYKIGSV